MTRLIVLLLVFVLILPAADFDGTTDRIDCTITALSATGDLWMSVFLNQDAVGDASARFFQTSGNEVLFWWNATYPGAYWAAGTTYSYCNDVIPNGGQHHLVMKLPAGGIGANFQAWIDGSECSGHTNFATAARSTSTTSLTIGDRSDSARSYNGRYTHLAVWDNATLTANDISNLAHARSGNQRQAIFSSSAGKPTLYWPLIGNNAEIAAGSSCTDQNGVNYDKGMEVGP